MKRAAFFERYRLQKQAINGEKVDRTCDICAMCYDVLAAGAISNLYLCHRCLYLRGPIRTKVTPIPWFMLFPQHMEKDE